MELRIGLQLIILSLSLLLLSNGSIIIVEDAKACFRRALAGKRITHRWVRRTLACERVEDCQVECGHEKRFTCEGFNYKLDPTGRGQGVCELIDVPLSEMDLYSSKHGRDENLLYHPDYDYYERDRNTCRPSPCTNCEEKPYGPAATAPDSFRPTTYRPPIDRPPVPQPYAPEGPPPFYRPEPDADKYRPSSSHHSRPPSYEIDRPTYDLPPASYDRPSTSDWDRPYGGDRPSGYDRPSPSYDRPPFDRPSGGSAYDRPYDRPVSGSGAYDRPPLPSSSFDSKPPDYDRYDVSGPGSGGSFRPPSPAYGGDVDRYDSYKPIEISRPGYQEIILTTDRHGYDSPKDFHSNPFKNRYTRPEYIPIEEYRPSAGGSVVGPSTYHQQRPSSDGNSYLGPYRPPADYEPSYQRPSRPSSVDHHHQHHPPSSPNRFPSSSLYLDRDPPPGRPTIGDGGRPPSSYSKPSTQLIPYSIGEDNSWGSYGGTYGGASTYSKYSSNYWGLQNDIKRKDDHRFNYFELGGYGGGGDNSVWNYPGSRYDDRRDKNQYASLGSSWTRRPGQDECSAKSSEGFRLHKGVVRYAYKAPSVTECERMCHSEDKFRCVTYSFRYNTLSRDNCLLCDRPVNQLDFYADIEPDRDYDIYAMTDDPIMCSKPPSIDRQNNAQCFFQAIDASRFFKSIVRDSLTVRSVGECEMECIKSAKFTCRAFSFRYGSKVPDSVIDNCLLSDWPVRDMDKDRHLVRDIGFDIFERASYGHGCEIQPIIDDKHKKLCYLGYGSPAKLLSSAIKKVISVPTELECKKECIRFRDTSPFKCLSFSFGSQASTFNCEMSDLDQSELKLNVHYAHTNERDYWLFAWNPFDWTCRDKVTTIGSVGSPLSGGGGSGGGANNRVNNDRRMDIFREPGDNTWTHFSVSGRPCRPGSGCEKNLITGFYSCELEGGEIGAWDYCCKTNHPCGYSQGFDYPWCYVGDQPDQWRTCSDRYYPKKSTKRPSSVSSGGPLLAAYSTVATSGSKKKLVVIDASPSPSSSSFQHHSQPPPRPGGLEDYAAARLWPVTYLYSSGPPNATELSNFVDCNKETC